MGRKYFGTDGVRGLVGVAPITPDFVMRLGYAAGKVLAKTNAASGRPTVLIGKDTRVSGYMLESALEAGFNAAGVDVMLAGPMPTPAVAYLTRALRLSAGVVISASHNPYQDNGIKFFSEHGTKLPDAVELEIEEAIDQPMECVSPEKMGRAKRLEHAQGRYIEFCKGTFPNELDLRGLKIVLDCAHGAAYHIAPHVFHELGAEVIAIGATPDGFNINAGFGATAPKAMAAAVLEHKADLGIALDGDADRLIVADERGQIVDGDAIMAVCGLELLGRGALGKATVVTTVMSNLGLDIALRRAGGRVVRTQVGDRYVVEEMRRGGYTFGGEQSGHMVFLEHNTTGDGLLSALQLLAILKRRGRRLSELAAVMERVPQVLLNVKVARKPALATLPEVQAAMRRIETALGEEGRLLVRYSGTENLARVMVEGTDERAIHAYADEMAELLTRSLS